MGRQVFTAGEILTAANMNDLGDQTVMVFDDATDRATAIPTPVEGMVTYLKDTDAIEKFDGTNFVVAAPPQTGVLQVVSTTLTTNFSASLSAGQFTPVTGLSATITPSSSSSKMFVSFSAPNALTTSDRNAVAFRLLRDSTEIGSATDASGSMTRGITGNFLFMTTAGKISSDSASFLDSPATSSSITYSVNVGNGDNSSGTVLINRNDRTDSNRLTYRLSSTITVMEVAG